MSKPNVRLTEADNTKITKVLRYMESIGMDRPTTADAVRFALKYCVERIGGKK